jgi:hypothetical protein
MGPVDSDEAATEVAEAPPVPSPPRNLASEAALERYAKRMRPLRRIYAAALAVVAIAVVIFVVVAYDRGEISHATLHTVAKAPSNIALQAAAPTQKQVWTSGDTTAIGTPYYEGTIITHNRHTVRGRNAVTGKQTWSYTRTDRDVCTAVQTEGVTVAVFKLHGDCDELTAVDSGTGKRLWERTLDKDGAVFDGPATYSVLPGNILFVSATSIYAISTSGTTDSNNGGLDYWVFHHPGCTIKSAVLGAGGALISQTCTHEKCDGAKFCGNGTQLLLRDGYKGTDDDDKTNKNNPDQIVWNLRGSDLIPTSAGRVITARPAAGGALTVYDAKTGKTAASLTLTGSSGSSVTSAFASALDADLISIGSRTYAVEAGKTAFTWQAATTTGATITATSANSSPTLTSGRIAAGAATGIAELDGKTGRASATYAVTAPSAASLVYPYGTGFLVAGPTTTVYQ